MFQSTMRTIVAASLLTLSSSLPAAAQSRDLQAYADAWRAWGDQMRQFRFAFQQPRPAVVAMGMSRSFLGVNVVEIDAAKAAALKLRDEVGVEITSIEPESPAEKAGLKVGDVVVEYQGQRVEGTEQFIRLVRETPGGRQVKLMVQRSGAAAQAITATIGVRKQPRIMMGENMPKIEMWMPDMPRAYTGVRSARLGVEAEGLGGQLAEYFGVKEGVLVRSVMKGSAAEKSGLKAGDVITKVDQKALDSPRELSEMLREKKTMSMTVVREKKEMTLSVTPEEERGGADRPARAVLQDFRF